MNLSKEQAKKLYSKLEYNFKKSKSALVEKLDSNSDIELSKEETQTLLKKLEYIKIQKKNFDYQNIYKIILNLIKIKNKIKLLKFNYYKIFIFLEYIFLEFLYQD
jgi:hypothetical protein